MQITQFEVKGLFNRFNYKIPLRGSTENQLVLMPNDMTGPSIVILYGPNGSGKTTILRMIAGMMELDFDVFRAIPFTWARLSFNDGKSLEVFADKKRTLNPIKVTYDQVTARIHPIEPGPATEADISDVDQLRKTFLRATNQIHFSLVDNTSLIEKYGPGDYQKRIRRRFGNPNESDAELSEADIRLSRRSIATLTRTRDEREVNPLAQRVQRFMNLAQGDYRSFFASKEPELFARIIKRLREADVVNEDAANLLGRLTVVRDLDSDHIRLGLRPDAWDYDDLRAILKAKNTSKEELAVIAAYVDVLESKQADRKLVAGRLIKFEHVINEFFGWIKLSINAEVGFKIESYDGQLLSEDQLSSGQYHLLFLLVEALVTRRRGTVIAIDEPELSMHISWQRKLIRALMECSAGAEPQFLLATHSPDLAANYKELMVGLGDSDVSS